MNMMNGTQDVKAQRLSPQVSSVDLFASFRSRYRAGTPTTNTQQAIDDGRVGSYSRTTAVVLGVIQILCAIVSVALGMVALILENNYHASEFGILAGLFFLLPGIFGVTSRNQMRCMILGYLGTSIAALVISSDVVVILAMGLNHDHDHEHESESAVVIINTFGLILALIEVVTALASIILCLMTFCQYQTLGPANNNNECPECRARQEQNFMPVPNGDQCIGISNLAFNNADEELQLQNGITEGVYHITTAQI